jgi:hypothetical protein
MVDAVEEAASKKNLHICKMLVGVNDMSFNEVINICMLDHLMFLQAEDS